MGTRNAGRRDSKIADKTQQPLVKKSPSRYRIWNSISIPPPIGRHKKPTDKEMTEVSKEFFCVFFFYEL